MKIYVEVWLAVASLHEYGRMLVSSVEIQREVQRLFGAARPGVHPAVAYQLNGSAGAVRPPVRSYLVRPTPRVYRLCRAGDKVDPARAGAPLHPNKWEVDEPYWPLWRKWSTWQTGAEAKVAAAAMSGPNQAESDADRVAAYIRGLDGFRLGRPAADHDDHMGATITEALLWGGPDHGYAVQPRVARLRQTYPHLQTTSQFASLLAEQGAEAVLDMGPGKARRVEAVTALLQEERVETEADLHKWLFIPANRKRLQEFRGVGIRTVEYLQLLVGIDENAVDRHLTRFLQQAGVQAGSYGRRKEIIAQAAALLEIDRASLEYSVCQYMSAQAVPSLAEEHPWYWAGNIQVQVATYLALQGYWIVSLADTESTEADKDLVARSPDGRLLWVCVKGRPESEVPMGARQMFVGGVFELVLDRGENDSVDLALALPDGYPPYVGLARRIAWLRWQMPFRIFWVAESGAVRED